MKKRKAASQSQNLLSQVFGQQKSIVFPTEVKDQIVLFLKPGSCLPIKGCLEFQVLMGRVEVFGVEQRGAAPSPSRWLSVCASPLDLMFHWRALSTSQSSKASQNKRSRLRWRLRKLCSEEAVEALLATFGPACSYVLVRSVTNSCASLLRSFLPSLFPPKTAHPFTYLTADSIQPVPPFYDQDEINSLISVLQAKLDSADGGKVVVLVCGAQNSGKSTLVRYLLNVLWSISGEKRCGVAHLETDVGQCEFTVPGCVSLTAMSCPLLSPNFCHLKEPLRSYFFGESSPANRPETYLRLISLLHREFQQMEDLSCLLVNTHGWLDGQGLAILQSIVDELQPAIVVEMMKNNDSQASIRLPHPSEYLTIHRVRSNSTEQPLSGRQKRELVVLSALSELLPRPDWASLVSTAPFRIPWHRLSLWFPVSVPPSRVLSILNASVVALCSVLPEQLGSHLFDDDGLPRLIEGDVTDLEVVGVGVVRCMDMNRGLIFVLTTLSAESLSRVNVLAKGDTPLPGHILFSQPMSVSAPYLMTKSAGAPRDLITYSQPLMVVTKHLRKKGLSRIRGKTGFKNSPRPGLKMKKKAGARDLQDSVIVLD